MEFIKYHGSGNDFVILDGIRQALHLEPREVRQICNRHLGVGADGLIIIAPSASSAYNMIYHNADGNIGSMCGNGARCAFHYAHALGYAGNQSRFEAYDGVHTAILTDEGLIAISMSPVTRIARTGPGQADFELNTGSPHYVRFVQSLESVDVYTEGRRIRNSDQYAAEGINVNFAVPGAESIRLRTYERGVENITLACGTGATATALAFAEMTGLQAGPISIEADGGRLEVDFERGDPGYRQVTLLGGATPVFEGRTGL